MLNSFHLCWNLNKLSIKYQSYPKSRKITAFVQKICTSANANHLLIQWITNSNSRHSHLPVPRRSSLQRRERWMFCGCSPRLPPGKSSPGPDSGTGTTRNAATKNVLNFYTLCYSQKSLKYYLLQQTHLIHWWITLNSKINTRYSG